MTSPFYPNPSQHRNPQWHPPKVRPRPLIFIFRIPADDLRNKEEAAHECVSEEALAHLKSYKYSSVDKSLISNYILKHYVRGQ